MHVYSCLCSYCDSDVTHEIEKTFGYSLKVTPEIDRIIESLVGFYTPDQKSEHVRYLYISFSYPDDRVCAKLHSGSTPGFGS